MTTVDEETLEDNVVTLEGEIINEKSQVGTSKCKHSKLAEKSRQKRIEWERAN
jgi:hypothetical protein